MWLLVSAVVVLIGLSALAGGVAGAEPSSPAPARIEDFEDLVQDERDGLRQGRACHVVGRVGR
jgi:hypothetical protein